MSDKGRTRRESAILGHRKPNFRDAKPAIRSASLRREAGKKLPVSRRPKSGHSLVANPKLLTRSKSAKASVIELVALARRAHTQHQQSTAYWRLGQRRLRPEKPTENVRLAIEADARDPEDFDVLAKFRATGPGWYRGHAVHFRVVHILTL